MLPRSALSTVRQNANVRRHSMVTPAPAPKSVGEVESFIDLLRAACEDKAIYDRLEALLVLPDAERKAKLHAWLTDLMIVDAPHDLVIALACLTDDKVAERAYEVIYKCQR